MKKFVPFILILILSACGPSETTKKLQMTPAEPGAPEQAVKPVPPAPKAEAAPSAVPEPPVQSVPESAPPMNAGTPVTPSGLAYTTPSGWTPEPPRGMREVSFRMESAPEVECYVSVLKGAAGGMEMNLNRWRSQIGQPPLTGAEISTLPKAKLMGSEVPLLDLRGAYQGMEDQAKPGYALLGIMTEWNNRMVFVKMTGPEAQVAAQKDAFLALCESLK